MSQTKILIIAGTMDVGGIENQLMHLIRNADRGKFQIDFTTTMSHPSIKMRLRHWAENASAFRQRRVGISFANAKHSIKS